MRIARIVIVALIQSAVVLFALIDDGLPGSFCRALTLLFSLAVFGYLAAVVIRRFVLTFGALTTSPLSLPPEPNPWPTVTVYVPCHNEQAVIGRCLDVLDRVAYPRDRFDVVVIDDGSTDETAQIATEFCAGRIGFRVLRRTPPDAAKGKPAALAYALKQTGGSIRFFLDADTEIAPHALKTAVRHLCGSNIGAVGGALIPKNSSDSAASFYTAIEAFTHQFATLLPASRMGLTSAVLGSNWGIREQTLRRFGLGEGELLEDSDLSVRLQNDGLRIVFDETMAAHFEVPADLGEYFRQHIGWNRGFFRIGSRQSKVAVAHRSNGPVAAIDRLIYSWGYADRLLLLLYVTMMAINIARPIFVAPVWFFGIVLVAPLLQLSAGMAKARCGWKDVLRLWVVPAMFAVDIAAVIYAAWLDATGAAPRWYKTARRDDGKPGELLGGEKD